ncbi:hypothetical protein GWI33_018594 [Rhynchophorus ferrugineus]|uniref:Uncharacterized protein n=1 Tax=Rhynchophorus ferrugineus TaxID=354439 RepID=A0A834M2B4_RHYFE|nr:hypothetical protein GWI33_018594 [Rhynchophorus ferrugineus]
MEPLVRNAISREYSKDLLCYGRTYCDVPSKILKEDLIQLERADEFALNSDAVAATDDDDVSVGGGGQQPPRGDSAPR